MNSNFVLSTICAGLIFISFVCNADESTSLPQAINGKDGSHGYNGANGQNVGHGGKGG